MTSLHTTCTSRRLEAWLSCVCVFVVVKGVGASVWGGKMERQGKLVGKVNMRWCELFGDKGEFVWLKEVCW